MGSGFALRRGPPREPQLELRQSRGAPLVYMLAVTPGNFPHGLPALNTQACSPQLFEQRERLRIQHEWETQTGRVQTETKKEGVSGEARGWVYSTAQLHPRLGVHHGAQCTRLHNYAAAAAGGRPARRLLARKHARVSRDG